MKYLETIFATGIHGIGKTYFSKDFAEKNKLYQYISFDKNFKYKDAHDETSLVPIFKLMSSIDKCIVDALPIANNKYESFLKYVEREGCSIVFVKCNIDTWMERIKTKQWYCGRDEKHINEYHQFYKMTPDGQPDPSCLFLCQEKPHKNNIKIDWKFYDSGEEVFYETMEELYDKT